VKRFSRNIRKLSEIYNRTSQIRRAADSIALNISEGSIGQSDAEFKRFIGYSVRSLAEVITCLYKALARSYITNEEFRELYQYGLDMMNMMIAFRRRLNG